MSTSVPGFTSCATCGKGAFSSAAGIILVWSDRATFSFMGLLWSDHTIFLCFDDEILDKYYWIFRPQMAWHVDIFHRFYLCRMYSWQIYPFYRCDWVVYFKFQQVSIFKLNDVYLPKQDLPTAICVIKEHIRPHKVAHWFHVECMFVIFRIKIH